MNDKEIGYLIDLWLKLGYITFDDCMPIIRKSISKQMNMKEEELFTKEGLKRGNELKNEN